MVLCKLLGASSALTPTFLFESLVMRSEVLKITGLLLAVILALYFLSPQSKSEISTGIKASNVLHPDARSNEDDDQFTATEWSKDQLGLAISKQEHVSPGFTLIPTAGDERIVLVDSKGKIVHEWKIDADRARLLPNANLLVVHASKWGEKQRHLHKLKFKIREYSWEGDVVGEINTALRAHHDLQRLENGNTLFLQREPISGEALARISDPARRAIPFVSDTLVEVNAIGQVVWRWRSADHLDWNSCGRSDCHKFPTKKNGQLKARSWFHMNTVAPLPENRFFDDGDARFQPGNILLVPRNWWEVLLISKESGEILWRFGDHKLGGLMYGHEAHMIPKGLPGAGNILIFDNGVPDKRDSIALEIDPLTKEILWFYKDPSFFSRAAGSLQRLPNGNTLISSDVQGRVFEVTPEKEIVWEYRLPFRTSRARRYTAQECPSLAQIEPSNN